MVESGMRTQPISIQLHHFYHHATMNSPRISLGMPVYNGEQYLALALDALLAQTFTDFELIISDNASTDRTEEICRAYAAKDSRIRYYRQRQNQGGAWNFNQVLHLATGEYFRWACHDDFCAPTLLERCVEVLDQEPEVVLCYPKTTVIDDVGAAIEQYPDQLNLRSVDRVERYRQFHHRYRRGAKCNVLFGLMRRQTLVQTCLIQPYPSSDIVLLGELALRGQYHEVPEFLFFRRDHAKTSVRAFRAFRDRIVWFDPKAKGQLRLTRWRWLFEHLAAIRRVEMPWQERLQCYLQMTQWVFWNLQWLLKDVLKAIAWPLLQWLWNRPPRVSNSTVAP